jgi:hypothetical protein
MANVWAIKSGDWSDTTVWNTGALPTSDDNVYANNFNVNINQNINVSSLRNTGISGVNAGGTFTFNTGGVSANISDNCFMNTTPTVFFQVTAATGLVSLNVPNGILKTAASAGLTYINYTGNCDLTINAIRISNADTGSGSNSAFIQKSSLGTLTINAEVVGGNNGAAWNTLMQSSNSTTIINGNVIGGASNSIGGIPISVSAGNLLVNGNVTGGGGNLSGNASIRFFSLGDLTIIGNVIGNISRAVSATSGTVNITGNITGSNSNGIPSVEINGTVTLNHIGSVQASIFSSAIACNTPTTSTVTCTGPFLRNGYIVAIASQTLKINFNSNSYFQFKKSNGDDIDYVSTVEGYNYPLASDVRYGVEYKSGLAIGTCHVPTPDNVRKNIPVDNTVGTSDNVNAEDILEAIQNSSLPIAERLRNVATVESTGAQITSFN